MVGLFLLIFFFAADANSQSCPKDKDLVTRVIDGDTIEVEDGRIIRILGIDTYDINRRMSKKQSYRTGYSIKRVEYLSEQASKAAKNLLLGQCVKLIADRKNKGAYNRYLRYVEVNNRDYQKIMLEKGLANVYCGDKKIKRFKKYLRVSKFKCED
jgi:micrococcal nuclease